MIRPPKTMSSRFDIKPAGQLQAHILLSISGASVLRKIGEQHR